MQVYEVEQYTCPPANVHVKYQPFKDYKGQHHYDKAQHFTLHIVNLYFLSINILHLTV